MGAARIRCIRTPYVNKKRFTFITNKRKANPLKSALRRVKRPTRLEIIAKALN